MSTINKLKKGESNPLEDKELMRKCASIISKKDNKLEIIDSVSFMTYLADIEKDLLEQADENDHVTYIRSGDFVKVLEVRKQ